METAAKKILFLVIKDTKGKQYLLLSEIARFEASDNYTIVVLKKDKKAFTICGCLKHHLERVEHAQQFCRIHNSHAVRIDFISRIDNNGTITLRDGTELPSTAEYREALEQKMPFC